MEMNKKIKVEVAYASINCQRILCVNVEGGLTIEAVIKISGILKIFPEIDLNKQSVGIFGKSRKLADTVNAGDRIEIYRPLIIDPKEARRAKAKSKLASNHLLQSAVSK